ncbi:hypothetical protein [Flexivirga alba]|uniref:Uncharacterized protein n=1 Tax=Flexivirga alba TaxID=702742 RepID=A0ABW2AAL0_9MICO
MPTPSAIMNPQAIAAPTVAGASPSSAQTAMVTGPNCSSGCSPYTCRPPGALRSVCPAVAK